MFLWRNAIKHLSIKCLYIAYCFNFTGNKFNIGEFHYTVLKNGAIPLDVLSNVIDEWIANQKGGSEGPSRPECKPVSGTNLLTSHILQTVAWIALMYLTTTLLI